MSDVLYSFGNHILTLGNSFLGSTGTPTLPAKTLRFKFDDTSYDPTASGETWLTGSTWTRVTSEPNVWDFSCSGTDWHNGFKEKFTTGQNYVYVIDGNMTGVEKAYSLFQSSTRLRSVEIYGLQDIVTNQTTGMASAFDGCSSLLSCVLEGYGTRTNDPGVALTMFYQCSSMTTCQLINTKLKYAESMFSNCSSLVSAPDMDLSGVTSTRAMFNGCSALQYVPNYTFNGLTNMDFTFNGCTSLAAAPSWDTQYVTSMASVLMYTAITSLPSWNTSSVTGFDHAFYGCSSLTSIGTLNTSNAQDVDSMFGNCYNVTSGALALYNQLSSMAIPPVSHDNTFKNCGYNTTTGAAELAQIPTSWGGTMS